LTVENPEDVQRLTNIVKKAERRGKEPSCSGRDKPETNCKITGIQAGSH